MTIVILRIIYINITVQTASLKRAAHITFLVKQRSYALFKNVCPFDASIPQYIILGILWRLASGFLVLDIISIKCLSIVQITESYCDW